MIDLLPPLFAVQPLPFQIAGLMALGVVWSVSTFFRRRVATKEFLLLLCYWALTMGFWMLK